MEIYGIDVSAYNPVSSYAGVAADGKKVAILRVTTRGNQPDSTFEKNYNGFRRAGLLVGCYKFSYALNVAEATVEATGVLEALQGKELDFPVFYDMEWAMQRHLPKEELNGIIYEFRRHIVEAGYRFGIYCNLDWYRNVLDVSSLPYDYWIAAYPYNDRGAIVETLRPPYGVGWQYSSKGRVSGINGNVDLDVFYKDYQHEPVPEKDDWVIRLQRVIGVVPDNIPGPQTLSGCPLLQEGSQGQTVRLVQERLAQKYEIPVQGGYDGVYGAGTKKAVIEFQKQKGLEADGVVGPMTWKAFLGL